MTTRPYQLLKALLLLLKLFPYKAFPLFESLSKPVTFKKFVLTEM